jgi:hypothetical protein
MPGSKGMPDGRAFAWGWPLTYCSGRSRGGPAMPMVGNAELEVEGWANP